MKNTVSILVILLLYAGCLNGQNDQEAVRVLDNFSRSALAAPSVSLKFRLLNIDEQKQKSDTTRGFLLMSKDQYRLEMSDNITWFNGSVSWNYLKKEKEVTITRPGKKDDSFMSRPSSIFTLYRKGYKTRLIQDNGKTYVVDLYPEDIKSDLIRIRLAINRTTYSLDGAEYKRKDGTSIVLFVDDFNLKTKPETTDFVFDQKKFKDAEINDMR